MFKTLLVFIVMSLSTTAFATATGGDRVGNGGDVVVCKNKVELLDIYEARLNGYEQKIPGGRNYKEMLENLLSENLAPIQPKRAENYLKHLSTFESEAAFLPGIELNDIDDSGMVAIPKGCKLKQIIIQLSDEQRPPGKKRYTVSLDLWNKLDEFNKMALALHEIVYREAISYTASNSLIVRAMVGELIRSEIDLQDYLILDWAFSRTIEFKKLFISNLFVQPEISFYQNEFQEDVFQVSSSAGQSFLAPFVGRDPLTFLEFRINDERVLKAMYGIELKAQLIRARTSYELNPSIFYTSSHDVDYKNNTFASSELFNLEINFDKTIPFQLLFENATKLEIDMEGTIVGNFSLNYKNLNFDHKGFNSISVNPYDGSVLGYNIKIGTARFEHKWGIFNCMVYGVVNSYHAFKNCHNEDTKFQIILNRSQSAPDPRNTIKVKLESTEEYLTFDSSNQLWGKSIKLIFVDKTYIGYSNFENKELYVEAGAYLYTAESGWTYITDSKGNSYRLSSGVAERL